jgi:hypothetical protein
MSGAFQTSREIFNNPIWKNIVDFRLFFLIYGQAIYSEEGYRMSEDLFLERGQWCRSVRKLQDDLTYIENRQIKTYSLSVISRCIKRLVDSQRVCTKTHELGTVFTVVNYESYQGLHNYKNDNMERNLEQSGNGGGTVGEQSGNNNKKENKEKKVKKVKEVVLKCIHASLVSLSKDEYPKLVEKYGTEESVKWAIEKLSNYKHTKKTNYVSDYHVLIGWVFDDYEKKKLTLVQGGQSNGKYGDYSSKNKTKGAGIEGWESLISGS